jgi:hypothetical protein
MIVGLGIGRWWEVNETGFSLFLRDNASFAVYRLLELKIVLAVFQRRAIDYRKLKPGCQG